ncbi:class I SAM-dependent methyltransferase [Terasakiella sp. SH-1]|uniref:class I SAM-dependent methyltransferase n=1 Tax=Terasakiella sp. SH-1 TaxID=2560057 RepID=UPI0010738F44|nr:class I SAM-dependent methyltransferase [Terasakiella sp. SH-1]
MEPSLWIKRFSSLVESGGKVLDVACGGGRHGRLFLQQGHSVVFIDKNIEKLHDLAQHERADIREMDLEDGKIWPFESRAYDAIIVTNYLYRPHLNAMVGSLKEGGILLYETFAVGNEQFGRPRSPDFLLQAGELLELVQGRLQVVAYEHGIDGEKVVQRLCAVHSAAPEMLNPVLA